MASAETQATPAPSPVPTAAPAPAASPNPFSYAGYVRAYYFGRTNSPSSSTLNQATYNNSVSLHGAYNFADSGFSVGATYLYATPFNGCTNPSSHSGKASVTNPCGKKSPPEFGIPPVNFDDTLGGFDLNTLYEVYLQYKNPQAYVKIGDQVINTPWANASDSRLKPVAFRGGDAIYQFNKNWAGEIMYMSQFESRASSDFSNSTLLTGKPIDAPGIAGNIYDPNGTFISNAGFGLGRVGYTSKDLTGDLDLYLFQDIASVVWVDGKYMLPGSEKPFVALQIGSEQNLGSAIIGKINSQVFGIQGGITPVHNVDVTVGYDYLPEKTDTVTLPAGVTCLQTAGSINQINASGSKGITFPYFLPSGGTPNCVNNTNGTTTIYYGGWASPYTDSYATDPLFDTSISQGMVDRRSPGNGVKISATYTTDNKRFKFIASQAYYQYGNDTTGVAPTQETDLDGTYYFNPVGKGAYHGLSLRQRWANRVQAFTNLYGGTPNFVYSRTQLEYDF